MAIRWTTERRCPQCHTRLQTNASGAFHCDNCGFTEGFWADYHESSLGFQGPDCYHFSPEMRESLRDLLKGLV